MAKRRNTRRTNTKKQGIPWGPMLLSFAVGIFVMFLLNLKNDKNKEVDNTPVVKKDNTKKQDFDFYTILPETKVVEPTNGVSSKPSATSKYYAIQVASFRKMTDADAVKAKLAFLGVESQVQKVAINDKDIWYRVIISPLNGRQKADKIQKTLKQNKMDSILVQLK